MKKSILTVAILALSSASFAGDYVDLPGDQVLPTNSVDCGGASTCMPDQTLNQGDNTSTKTAQQDLNGNAVTISPVLTDENVNKNNITGGNTTSTGGTTTSTGGTNTATGGTYTTGALNAGGATVGNTDNASSATTGASSSSIGNTSTGGNSLAGGTQTAQTGASTSSTGAVTVNPNNTNSQSLADNSTRNTSSKATGGSVGNTSTGASTSSTGAVTVTPTSNQNAAANNSAKTGSNTSTTNVDAADRSTTNYRSVALVLPSVGVTAPSTVAIGNIIKETMACGILQTVQRDDVKGTYLGVFKKSEVNLGTDDTLVPFINEAGEETYYKRVLGSDGKYRLMGHQPVIYTTQLSVSGARNLSLGGGGSNQEWGQAGVGASSAMTRLVSKIQLRSCVAAVEEVATVTRIKQ